MIQMTCPGCGAKLKGPDSAIGQKTKCPKCGTVVTVEPDVYEAEAVDDDAGGPGDIYGLADGDPGPAKGGSRSESGLGGEPTANRRPCPMCGEMIVVGAPKCRFCGEVFDPTLRAAESKKRGGSGGASDSNLTTSEILVAIMCSGIGCICGIIWMIQGKPKGGKMFGISFISGLIWGGIRFAIEMSQQGGNGQF